MLILQAEDAWAWGPVTHTAIALDIVANPLLLAVGIASLLKANKAALHSVKAARRLTATAVTAKQKAFALGYLGHMASDFFAHHVVIPAETPSNGRSLVEHLTFESLVDALMQRSVKRQFRATAVSGEIPFRHLDNGTLTAVAQRRFVLAGLVVFRALLFGTLRVNTEIAWQYDVRSFIEASASTARLAILRAGL